MHLKENTLLQGGKYRIIRKLGQGGYGITYLAEDTMLRVNVAIKEFFIEQYCNRDVNTGKVSVGVESMKDRINGYYEKFIKEAGKIRALNHPNIVRVYDVFNENGTAYYAMDYHSNGSLSELLNKRGVLSENDAIRYIRQVASALKHIHNNNMLHLDVNPNNILLNRDDNAILIDFGISKHYNEKGKATTLIHGGYTPGFAAKSQTEGDKVNTFSPTFDIYSLGATLYNLVTGETPPSITYIFDYGFSFIPDGISSVTRNAIEKSMAPKSTERAKNIDEFLLLLDAPTNGSRVTQPMNSQTVYNKQDRPSDGNSGNKEPQNPFNWKPLIGIIAAILCIVFAGVGINKCNDYRAKQKRLAAIEKARQDSIAAVKRYNDSIAMVKRHNDSINKALAIKDAEQQRRDSIANLPGILYITTNPAGATVTVAGKRVGNTPIEKYKLKKGSYNVKITKDGYNTISKNITISNDPTVINIALTKTVKKETNKQNNKLTSQEIEKYYNDGVKAYNAGNYSEAVRLYRKAAEQGEVNAQFNLGYCYYNGEGVTKDYTEAVKWYRKAAEQGNADAQCNLGYCYKKGQGVSKDYIEAVKWYRKAAEQGEVNAQFNLGYCYYNGEGVTKDYTEAVKWYCKAAEQGNAQAQCNLGYCYKKGQGVSKDYIEAVKWYHKAAEQGDATAQCNLGYCYEKGQGVSKDYIEAVKWYRKAAEQGNAIAQYNLGSCYYHGEGVTKDYTEAVKWNRKAAEQGDATAQCNLGYCYEKGIGVAKDYIEAVKWYRKAAEQGHEKAKAALERLGK